jgi:hypothetical protein
MLIVMKNIHQLLETPYIVNRRKFILPFGPDFWEAVTWVEGLKLILDNQQAIIILMKLQRLHMDYLIND